MSKHWLEVVDVEKLVNFSRKMVFHNFDDSTKGMEDAEFFDSLDKIGSEINEEMNKLLPYIECKNMFMPLCKVQYRKKSKARYFLIKEDDYDDFLVQLSYRMSSNIVKGLVEKGVLESAFDDERNDFVFWVKNHEDEQSKEKPETD